MARRMVVFGVDGLVLPLIEHLVREGRLPNFARMFAEGAVTKLLPFVSTWGPINWMCFATGTSPGTAWQGRVDVPGLEQAVGGQQGAYSAETLWQAAERSQMTSAVIAYPACWPPTIRRGVIAIPDRAGTNLPPVELAGPARYVTRGLAARFRLPPGTRTGWIPLAHRGRAPRPLALLDAPDVPTDDWRGLPDGDPLVTVVGIRGLAGQALCEIGLVIPRGERPCGRALLCEGKDGSRILARLRVGKWSDWISLCLGPEESEASVRFKLHEVAEDGREVAICHSQVYPRRGFAYPREIEGELVRAAGPYASGSSAQLRPDDPCWETAIEEATYEGQWLVKAAEHLAAAAECQLFVTVFRPVDAANHGCLAYLDPDLAWYGGPQTPLSMEILARAYGVADDALGAFMGMADGDTVVAVASDHGAVINRVTCDIYNLLVENGLLAIEDLEGGPRVDWFHTRAYIRPTRSGSEIFVNLAGREPHGIVDPGEYESLQEKIIDLLLDWREAETGKRAVALALKKKDAAMLGYWGKEAGDVQFIYNSGVVWGELPQGQTIARTGAPSVNHGPQIPTTEKGLTTNMGMLALWGPGVRRGYRRPDQVLGPARMCDPAPTLAYLLGCDPPLHNEGTILRDMLD